MTERRSSRECPTQVRCAIGVSVVSLAIPSVTRMVRSRVDPPAPYVTDTNVGCRPSSSRNVDQSCRSPASSLGGKNSKEMDRSPAAISWSTLGALTCAAVEVRSAIRNSIVPNVGSFRDLTDQRDGPFLGRRRLPRGGPGGVGDLRRRAGGAPAALGPGCPAPGRRRTRVGGRREAPAGRLLLLGVPCGHRGGGRRALAPASRGGARAAARQR